MKYWFGYLTAAIIACLTWVLMQFGQRFSTLVDMVYPYVIRTLQDILAGWSGAVDFLLWQLLAVALAVVILASLVAVIAAKKSVIAWGGWVLSACALVYLLHTMVWGLNYYAGPLSEDIRMEVGQYTVEELAEATEYYRDRANILSRQVDRSGNALVYPTFDEMADRAYMGFQRLVYDRSYPIFAGCTLPVKQLGWADMYTSMGISGMTMPLTGEAAVNPQIPTVSLPFTICHEMAHRMCIAPERDANLAAFLASTANSDPAYQYSGYFMAFRYCYNALASMSTSTAAAAANRIYEGMNDALRGDIEHYRAYLLSVQDADASKLASSVNDAYIQASGDSSGVRSYGEVTDLLISWYLQEIYLPEHEDEVTEDKFDPLDKEDVFTEEVMGG